MKAVVVIPTRNEADNIGHLVRRALEHVDHVLVADDGSTDETPWNARMAGANVMLVPAWRNGLAGVYACGLAAALKRYELREDDIVIEMDAGGSHDPDELENFVVRMRNTVWSHREITVLCGVRSLDYGYPYKVPFRRRLLSWLGTTFTNWWHGTRFEDATSGYIAYGVGALRALLEKPYVSEGHYYQTEVRLRARRLNLVLDELPISYKSTSSSLNWRSIVEALRLMWRRL